MVKADAKILEASLHREVLQQSFTAKLNFAQESLRQQEEPISVYVFCNFLPVGWVFIAIDTGTQCWRDLKCWQTKERVDS